MPNDDRSTMPIVIGGFYRSGTSLVRRLLDAHPNIHCGPEVKFFRDFYADYQSDPLSHLRFMATARSILDEEKLLEIMGRAFVEVHRQAAESAGKRRWADKNPDNMLYLDQWEALLGESWLFVHVLRDPLDVMASLVHHPFPLSVPSDLVARLDRWEQFVRRSLDFQQRHAGRRSYLLRYEDLVTDPPQALFGLMSWLGERVDPGQFAFNRSPHQEGLEDPKVRITSTIVADRVGQWRQTLDPSDASVIEERTSALMRELDNASYTGSA